jgi:hypothetical protein
MAGPAMTVRQPAADRRAAGHPTLAALRSGPKLLGVGMSDVE